MNWQPISEFVKVNGTEACISGYLGNIPGNARWYALATFVDGVWYDLRHGDDYYPPTHFVLLSEVPK